MITFWLACAALVLFSGLFYLFPGRALRRPLDDRARANLEWYRLRRRELAEDGDTGLETDAQLRLLEDDQRQVEAPPRAASTRFPVWLLLPVIALAAGGLYYQLGAAPDVEIAKRLQALDERTDDTAMLGLMDAIAARAAQRPDNLHYLALLGRFYMGQGAYAQAADTYRLLAEGAPEDAQALAYAAQANYLAAGRELDPKSQALAEQSLAINPHQRTALGLLGMAAFERGQYRAAIQYWPAGNGNRWQRRGADDRRRDSPGPRTPG